MSEVMNVTQLLEKLSENKHAVGEAIAPLVYQELHRLAKNYMQAERTGHTLQATCLVNEAFINLVEKEIDWENREHFYAIAAKQMRRILIDHARNKAALKRGDNPFLATYTESIIGQSDCHQEEIIIIDELLEQLALKDPENADIFELKYFAGLTLNEIAELKGFSLSKVEREIRFAKAWLSKKMVND